MRKSIKIFAVALMLVTGLAAAPAIYADESAGSKGSMMGAGKMGKGGMMGQGGMMNMMGQMNQMMANCNKMIESMMDKKDSAKPNKQWRKGAPSKPKNDG